MFSQCVSICPLNEQDYFNHEGSQNVWNWTPQNTPYLFIYSPKEREKDLVFSWWENALRQFQHKSTTLKPPLILLNSYKIITIILMHTLTFSTKIRRRTIFTKKMLQYFQNDPTIFHPMNQGMDPMKDWNQGPKIARDQIRNTDPKSWIPKITGIQNSKLNYTNQKL